MNTLYSFQVRGPHNTTLRIARSKINYTATSFGRNALGHTFSVRFVDYLMLAETCSHAVSIVKYNTEKLRHSVPLLKTDLIRTT
jgi:hypothetical protein